MATCEIALTYIFFKLARTIMGHNVFRAMKNNILFTSNLSLDFLNILIYINYILIIINFKN